MEGGREGEEVSWEKQERWFLERESEIEESVCAISRRIWVGKYFPLVSCKFHRGIFLWFFREKKRLPN